MESKAKNLYDALGSTLSTANAAKLASIQADAAQAVALQALIKAARLALCYPNPCMHGGLCAANPDNSSFTCFCSSFYKGTTCQTLKGASVFNAGTSLKNYENIIHTEVYKLKKRNFFKEFNSKLYKIIEYIISSVRIVSLSPNSQIQSLFVEDLVVIDNSVYSLFKNDFGSNIDSALLNNYIKIFFCQMVNSVTISYSLMVWCSYVQIYLK
jgi:hypothetical protein